MKFFLTKKRATTCFALFCALFLLANQIAFSQYVCQPSGSPIVQMGSLTAGDPMQTGRVVRGGIPSTCVGKGNNLQNATPVNYDSYTFNAPVTGCATVDFDATACGGATTQAVAYSTFTPATPNTGVIGDFGFSTIGIARFAFPVTQGQNFTVVVHDILETPTNVLCANYTFTINYKTGCRQPGFDQTNDRRADPVVFRPSSTQWLTLNSAGGTLTQTFGLASDLLTSGDYTGDGNTDVAVFRPSTSFWYYGNNTVNPGQNFTAGQFGLSGDIPVHGDYDGDGRTDIAVWRPSDGFWYILRSSNGVVEYKHWGKNGDIPVTGDFDGDLKTDFVVVRPDEVGVAPNYVWFVQHSNFSQGFAYFRVWGTAGDKIVPGDYDGNGKSDITVFRPSDGTWYSVQSNAANAGGTVVTGFNWGLTGDIPQPADYDADGRTDYAIFRPSTGIWYLSNSNNGTYNSFSTSAWGNATDVPATAPYRILP
jgi:hypothetical protein